MGAILRLLSKLPKSQALQFGEKLAARMGLKRTFSSVDDVAKFIGSHVRKYPVMYSAIGSVAASLGIDFAIDEVREAFESDVPQLKSGAGAQALELGLTAIAVAMAKSDARVERNAGDGDPDTIYGADAEEYTNAFLAQEAEVLWLQAMARQYGGYEALRNLMRLVNTEPRMIDIAEASAAQRRSF